MHSQADLDNPSSQLQGLLAASLSRRAAGRRRAAELAAAEAELASQLRHAWGAAAARVANAWRGLCSARRGAAGSGAPPRALLADALRRAAAAAAEAAAAGASAAAGGGEASEAGGQALRVAAHFGEELSVWWPRHTWQPFHGTSCAAASAPAAPVSAPGQSLLARAAERNRDQGLVSQALSRLPPGCVLLVQAADGREALAAALAAAGRAGGVEGPGAAWVCGAGAGAAAGPALEAAGAGQPPPVQQCEGGPQMQQERGATSQSNGPEGRLPRGRTPPVAFIADAGASVAAAARLCGRTAQLAALSATGGGGGVLVLAASRCAAARLRGAALSGNLVTVDADEPTAASGAAPLAAASGGGAGGPAVASGGAGAAAGDAPQRRPPPGSNPYASLAEAECGGAPLPRSVRRAARTFARAWRRAEPGGGLASPLDARHARLLLAAAAAAGARAERGGGARPALPLAPLLHWNLLAPACGSEAECAGARGAPDRALGAAAAADEDDEDEESSAGESSSPDGDSDGSGGGGGSGSA